MSIAVCFTTATWKSANQIYKTPDNFLPDRKRKESIARIVSISKFQIVQLELIWMGTGSKFPPLNVIDSFGLKCTASCCEQVLTSWPVAFADSGVGAGIDSYYEYLMKAYILLGDDVFLQRFNTVSCLLQSLFCLFATADWLPPVSHRYAVCVCARGGLQHYSAIMKYISQPPLLLNVHMHNPTVSVRSWMDSLLAFFPGLQVRNFSLRISGEKFATGVMVFVILAGFARRFKTGHRDPRDALPGHQAAQVPSRGEEFFSAVTGLPFRTNVSLSAGQQLFLCIGVI